ncbi:MAG: hypothetical protein R3C31_07875 [Hyphomonadaceae bacterium]
MWARRNSFTANSRSLLDRQLEDVFAELLVEHVEATRAVVLVERKYAYMLFHFLFIRLPIFKRFDVFCV